MPWGEPRDELVDASTRDPAAPWPGAVPGPSPARVFDPPLPAELLDADGAPGHRVGRGEPSASPAVLRCAALPGGGGPVVAVGGPWPHDVRWWDRTGRRRRVVWQVVVGRDDGDDTDQVACLVAVEPGRAARRSHLRLTHGFTVVFTGIVAGVAAMNRRHRGSEMV